MTFSNGRLTEARDRVLALILALLLSLSILPGCSGSSDAESTGPNNGASVEQPIAGEETSAPESADSVETVFDVSQVPSYTGSPYTVVSGNVPDLSESGAEGVTESYSSLDSLGRCGVAMAVVSPETMPTEERGSVGMVKPSGWHTVRYDDLVDGKHLYNRCHLLGYQLTGENANEENLITGARYMNVEGMLPFEDEVADYVELTGGSVLMRVTPVFVGEELVARGVHMEALSLGDGGQGVSFNVCCYNVQPGISIDYATGDSRRSDEAQSTSSDVEARDYVLNTSSRKFHLPGCASIDRMAEENKQEFTRARDELISQGYEPCGNCNPQPIRLPSWGNCSDVTVLLYRCCSQSAEGLFPAI